jgi:hypothetical protein
MKKRIALFVATVLTTVALPAAAFASSSPAITQVSGEVTHNGSPVDGANVTVTCDSVTGNDTTDSDGGYLVTFAKADCPNGSTATSAASKGGLNGNNSGPVNKLSSKLNIAIVDVSVVPEFGLIGLTGAALIGGAGFMVMRRRQLGDHQA